MRAADRGRTYPDGMNLSALQLAAYDSFGFLVLPRFLSPERVEELRAEVSRLKAGESGESDLLRHTGRVVGMFHKSEPLLALFDDPRLDAAASTLLRDRDGLRFLGDEYVSYSTPADWHPDMGPDEPFEALKFAFYLDDLSRGGCLRVVPGSHHAELSRAVSAYRAAAEPAAEMPWAHACVVEPGDLLVFNLKLWHQGTANPPGTHRRVIFWSVGQGKSEAFRRYARTFHERVGRGGQDGGRTPGAGENHWPEAILREASPRRWELLDVRTRGED